MVREDPARRERGVTGRQGLRAGRREKGTTDSSGGVDVEERNACRGGSVEGGRRRVVGQPRM